MHGVTALPPPMGAGAPAGLTLVVIDVVDRLSVSYRQPAATDFRLPHRLAWRTLARSMERHEANPPTRMATIAAAAQVAIVFEVAVTTGLAGLGLFLAWLLPSLRRARGALLLFTLVVLAGGLLELLSGSPWGVRWHRRTGPAGRPRLSGRSLGRWRSPSASP